MEKNQWLPRAAAGLTVTAALLGAALAAGQQGTQDDPLVTLSYLNQKAAPAVLTQVDTKLAEREQALTEQLEEAIQTYSKAMEDRLAAVGGGAGQTAAFVVVDVAAGQRLTADAGCELMLRVGSAVCFTDASPGLIDMTDGGTLDNGGTLVRNHLYMATMAGRGFTAQEAVKVLVRGSYTVT